LNEWQVEQRCQPAACQTDEVGLPAPPRIGREIRGRAGIGAHECVADLIAHFEIRLQDRRSQPGRELTGWHTQCADGALEHTGGGTVTGTEVGDEEGFYEVEVVLDNGSQVDVHLDRGFRLLSTKADTQDAGDQGDASDG